MKRKTEPKTLDDLIDDARAAQRELREAMKDSRIREREFEGVISGMRHEMVQYTQGLARQIVDELVRIEFEALRGELQRLVADVERIVHERATQLFQQYMQQEITDAPSVDQMFEARRVLARWQRAYGALPVGHAPGQFELGLGLRDDPIEHESDQGRSSQQQITEGDERP